MVEAILAASPGPDVLDVGMGTGISARPFMEEGCRVLGIDPDERMAGYARSSGLDVEIATFETWERAGRTFDAVVAGQSWHWVDPVAGASKAADVLRPGGLLAPFWNVMSFAPELAKGFSAVYRRLLPDLPWLRAGTPGGSASYAPLLDQTADGIRRCARLGEPDRWDFGWQRPYTRDEWLDIVPTFGGHGQLPPEQLERLLTGIGEVIDSAGGSITVDYTAVITARRDGLSPA